MPMTKRWMIRMVSLPSSRQRERAMPAGDRARAPAPRCARRRAALRNARADWPPLRLRQGSRAAGLQHTLGRLQRQMQFVEFGVFEDWQSLERAGRPMNRVRLRMDQLADD